MEELFAAFAKQNNWTSEKQIQILLDYIDNQKSNDALVDFLEQLSTPEGQYYGFVDNKKKKK